VNKSTETIAKINGWLEPYDACSARGVNPDPDIFESIGTGTIHMIDGAEQHILTKYVFYRRKAAAGEGI
jgi:hypothetical protein